MTVFVDFTVTVMHCRQFKSGGVFRVLRIYAQALRRRRYYEEKERVHLVS